MYLHTVQSYDLENVNILCIRLSGMKTFPIKFSYRMLSKQRNLYLVSAFLNLQRMHSYILNKCRHLINSGQIPKFECAHSSCGFFLLFNIYTVDETASV